MKLPESLECLIEHLSKLPGVGSRSATRQGMNLASWTQNELYAFADSLKNIAHIKHCSKCNAYSDDVICNICSSPKRSVSATICVVETISDLMAMERSEQYHGLYYVLGGVLNPLLGIGPQELELERLVRRIEQENIMNVILAINPSVEGDVTCSYINDLIAQDINVERIGFGIPMGGSLEYVDSMTISKALENRKTF